MRTRYPFTRVIATLLGAWMTWIFVETLRDFLLGPPSGCQDLSYSGDSGTGPGPFIDLCLVIAWESLVVSGTVMLWIRPWMGFFIAGMGYQLYWTLTLADSYCEWSNRSLEQGMWILRLLTIPVGLYYVGVKDEPLPSVVPSKGT